MDETASRPTTINDRHAACPSAVSGSIDAQKIQPSVPWRDSPPSLNPSPSSRKQAGFESRTVSQPSIACRFDEVFLRDRDRGTALRSVAEVDVRAGDPVPRVIDVGAHPPGTRWPRKVRTPHPRLAPRRPSSSTNHLANFHRVARHPAKRIVIRLPAPHRYCRSGNHRGVEDERHPPPLFGHTRNRAPPAEPDVEHRRAGRRQRTVVQRLAKWRSILSVAPSIGALGVCAVERRGLPEGWLGAQRSRRRR